MKKRNCTYINGKIKSGKWDDGDSYRIVTMEMAGATATKFIKRLMTVDDSIEWDGRPLQVDNKPLFNKYRRYSVTMVLEEPFYNPYFSEIGVHVTDYYRHPRKPKETAMCQPRKPREPREEVAR